jgi:hypothetical protein
MRCRLFVSWCGSTCQGLGCSPMKTEHEMGSERRETVRSISGMSVWSIESGSSVVREDSEEHTSGVPVVMPVAHAG